eukprot:Phypoly_transcript_03439.p1 GENE.Phypoly_transcript_03439~~Phypoly_transcript_03439.p1  ORF type:complete len:768 (+),score=84.19 Phypoly_transcript_03439:95-2398(+)
MEVLEERKEQRTIYKLQGSKHEIDEGEREREEEGGGRKDYKAPGRCFSIDSFLSKRECRYFIEESERLGLEDISHEYEAKYRNSRRVLFSSRFLANRLFKRLMQEFCYDDIVHAKPYGFYKSGTWKPVGLNDVFKVSRYEEDNHFRPHFDGCFVVSDACRSIYTLLIYLNEDFEGGETRFFETLGSETCPEVKPLTGRALVFNHDLRHEGAKVTKGKKYIMKTEVLFRRTDKFIPITLPTRTPKGSLYLKSLYLYHQADILEKKGDIAGATAAYLKAQELQIQYKAEVPQKEVLDTGPFVLDIFLLIMGYLSVAEQLKCSMASYAWYKMVHSDIVWQRNYSVDFPDLFAVESALNKTTKRADKAFLKDWAEMYKRSYAYTRSECSTFCVDLGAENTSVYDFRTKRTFTERTVVAREYHPHFVMSGLSLMDSWRMGSEIANGCNIREVIKPFNNGEVVDWSALWLYLHYAFHACARTQGRFKKQPPLHSQMHPVLFSEGRKPLDRSHLYYTMFMLFETPAICIENSAVLALCAFGKSSGLVVNCGCTETVITPVVNGAVLKEYEKVYPIGGELLGKMLYNLVPDYETQYRPGKVIKWWGTVFLDYERDMPVSTTDKNLSNPGRVEERNATLLTVEAFFDPKKSLATKTPFPPSTIETPFVNFVYQTIMECEEDKRHKFFNNIVLCGGLAAMPGFKARFENDFRKLKPDFHILMTKTPQATVVQGGKNFASLSNFRTRCVTRAQYISSRLTDNPSAFDHLVLPELTTMN